MSVWFDISHDIADDIVDILERFSVCYRNVDFKAQRNERILYVLESLFTMAVQASYLPLNAQHNETEAQGRLEFMTQVLRHVNATVNESVTEVADSQANSSRRRRHDRDDNDGPRPPKRRRST